MAPHVGRKMPPLARFIGAEPGGDRSSEHLKSVAREWTARLNATKGGAHGRKR